MEYLVDHRRPNWAQSLKEENGKLEEPINTASGQELILEGYNILFNKKVTLLPADLVTIEKQV